MSKKKKFLGLFAILFVAIFAVGCVFATACGKKNKEESVPEHVHEYTVLNQGDADGHYYTCPDDGDKGEVTPHTYGEWKTEKEADCGNYGTQTRACSVCGYVDTDATTLSPTGSHTYTATSTVTWSWTWDETEGYTAVTAKVTCDVCKQTTTVDGEITATPDEGIYGQYAAEATVGGQKYETTKTATEEELPYEPDEVAYSLNVDFSKPETYSWITTTSVTDDEGTYETVANGATFTKEVLTFNALSDTSKTTSIGKESEGSLNVGGQTKANDGYFKIDLTGCETDYVTIDVTFDTNSRKGNAEEDARSIAIQTGTSNTKPDKNNSLAFETSTVKGTPVTMSYGREVTSSSNVLYITYDASVNIYTIDINLYGTVEPDFSGNSGNEPGGESGEVVDESLFAVSTEQNVTLDATATSKDVTVSVQYNNTDYTGQELDGYYINISSSDEGIVGVTKEITGETITVSTSAVSGTATVTVAVMHVTGDDLKTITTVQSASINVAVTGVAADDTTDMTSKSITFAGVNAGEYTSDITLTDDADGVDVVATATSEKKVTVEALNSAKADPQNGASYTSRLKLGGAGAANYKGIQITTKGEAVIRFAIFSSDSAYTSVRTANFYKYVDGSSGDELLYTNDAVRGYGDLVIWTVYVEEAGTYYMVSTGNINVYAVDILYAPAVEEDENASGYDTPAEADASVGPIGSWAGTAYFEISYSLFGTSNTDVCKADVSIAVTDQTFTLEIAEFVDVEGSLASLLNALAGGIYLSTSYTGSNGTYQVSYNDTDLGQIDVTAIAGQDEKGDYLSVSFEMSLSLEIIIAVSATIEVDDQRVRRTDGHVHSYDSEAKYDDDGHWTGSCTCGGKTGFAAHTFGEVSETTAPSCETAGKGTQSCNCGYSVEIEIPATGHSYPSTSAELTWDWAGRTNGIVSVTFECSACHDPITTTAEYTYANGKLTATATFEGCGAVYEGFHDLSAAASAADIYEAVENGLTDITLTENIEGTLSFEVSDGQTLEVTIDLAGNTITAGEDGENTVTIGKGATLTISDSVGNGTIGNSYTTTEGKSGTSVDNAAAIYVEGTLVIKSGTIESSSIGVKAEDGAEVTINGGTITSGYFAIWLGGNGTTVTINDGTITGTDKGIVLCGDGNYGHDDYQTGAVQTLNVNGGTLKCVNDSVITTLGITNSTSSVINITGGTLIGADIYTTTGEEDAAVKTGTPMPTIYIASGTLNISGEPIIYGSTPVEIRGGTATISGGTFTVSAEAPSSHKNNSSGATSYGYAIAVFPYGTGVAFEYTDESGSKTSQAVNNAVAVYITGGTFDGEIYASVEGDYVDAKYSWATYTFEISGGFFSADPSAYLAEGYTVITTEESGDDYIQVVAGTKIKAEDNLNEMLAALSKDEEITIVLGEDRTGTIAVTAGDVTLNLNGYTVESETKGESAVTVAEGASLTIVGGSIEYSEEGAANTSLDNTAAVYSKGDLVLDGVEISSDSIGVKAEGGTVTIEEGTTIESVYFALWLGGGTVEAVINGGTISGTNKGIVLCGDGDYGYGSKNYQENAVQTLTVNGGTLTCENDSVITTLGITNSYSSVINIYGGELIGADVNDGATGTPFPTIYIASGTLNIYGGEIKGSTPVEIRGGTTNIYGGALTCTAQATSSASNNSSGATSYGYALSVFPYGTGVAFSDEGSTAVNNAAAVYVTGGTFIGGIYASSEDDYVGAKYSWATYTFEISGGYFNEDPSGYVDTEVYNVVTVDDGELAGYYKVLSIDGLWGGGR